MPDDNYYDDGSAQAPQAEAPAADKSGDQDDSGETSILPKTFFHGDVKPGDTCHIKVVAVHESDVEVQCDHSDEKEPEDDEAGAGEPPAAAPQEGSMASMMQ